MAGQYDQPFFIPFSTSYHYIGADYTKELNNFSDIFKVYKNVVLEEETYSEKWKQSEKGVNETYTREMSKLR